MAKRVADTAVEVIRETANVDIWDDDLPDAKTFAEKYNVELDDGDFLGSPQRKDDGEALKDILLNRDLVERTDGLVKKLDEKNREVERLCTLLESVSVVPGVNPDKLLDIYDNTAEEPIDLRDSKIVHLAKKVRNLTMTLNKERSLKIASDDRAEACGKEVENLKRELHLLSSPAARATARGESKESKCADQMVAQQREPRKELAAATKQVVGCYSSISTLIDMLVLLQIEELRHKLHAATEENKRLQRALVKEIGDGTTIEQVIL